MTIFTRFRDIVSSNINAMLDRAEDPEKMIKLMIREMEDTLIELKAACAGVIAGQKKVQRRLEQMEIKAQEWAEKAKLAVNKGRDDLAREALLEKKRYNEFVLALENEGAEHDGLIEQYHKDIEELEEKLTSAKEKQRMLIQRHRHASGKKRAQQNIRSANSAETMARFEHLESRIERMEAEAEIINPPKKPTLEEEIDNLAMDDEIEQELEKMKKDQQQNPKEADA